MGFPHGALYVKCPDVLPVLLEQRDQEIDGAVDVPCQFILTHFNMANGHCKTENLGELDRPEPKITELFTSLTS